MSGNHLKELGPDNTEGLQFSNLWMVESDLKLLRPHTFGGISNMWFLTFRGNKLEAVPTGLFVDPTVPRCDKQLQDIDMSSNVIRSISPAAFHGVKNFENIILSHNRLVSSGLAEDVLVNPTIKILLDLSSNRLTTIPDRLLRSQNKLQHLYLHRNQIKVLNDKIFRGLASLEELMIFDNPITEVVDWLFYETKLINLYMFQTNLTSLGARPFATKNSTIKKVSLYGNHLTQISDVVWRDLGADCYVELVGDGFAQPINVENRVASILRRSGFRCNKCRAPDLWKCTPCPQGHYGRSWADDCEACPPGGFYQFKTGQLADEGEEMKCQNCNNGTFVTPAAHPGKSPADCVVCPTGTNKSLHAGFRACPCVDDYYRKDRFGECLPCPIKGINCSEEYQHLLPGFWWTWTWSSVTNYQSYTQFVQNVRTESANYASSTQEFSGVLPKVHSCPRRQSCQNTGEGITATCEDGYTGWLCTQCSREFYSWLGRCFKCPEWWWFLLEALVVCMVIVVIVFVTVLKLRRNRKPGRSILNVFLARGKILLGFYQVMGEIFSALHEIPWPKTLTNVDSFFRMLEVNVMQLIISPRCYFPDFTYPSVYIEFLLGFSFVVFVVLAALCFYGLKRCWLKVKETPVQELTLALSRTKHKCYLFVVILLFVSYPGLSSAIFTLLPSGCDLFYLDENEAFNVTRLRSDYSIDCGRKQHLHFNYAAEAALCYVVGFPFVLLVFLWRSYRKKQKSGILNPRDTSGCGQEIADIERGDGEQPLLGVTGEGGFNAGRVNNTIPHQTQEEPFPTTEEPSRDNINWESFLCENYKAQFWYWEIVELARKVLQTLFVLLFGPEDHFTLFATILISVGFLLIHAYWRPMKDATEHRLQMFSLGTIFLNLLAASLLLLPSEHSRPSEERKEALAVILVLLNLSIIALVAASLIWTGMKVLWRHGCFGRVEACVGRVCCWYCTRRRSDRNNRQDNSGRDSVLILDDEYAQIPYVEVIARCRVRPRNV